MNGPRRTACFAKGMPNYNEPLRNNNRLDKLSMRELFSQHSIPGGLVTLSGECSQIITVFAQIFWNVNKELFKKGTEKKRNIFQHSGVLTGANSNCPTHFMFRLHFRIVLSKSRWFVVWVSGPLNGAEENCLSVSITFRQTTNYYLVVDPNYTVISKCCPIHGWCTYIVFMKISCSIVSELPDLLIFAKFTKFFWMQKFPVLQYLMLGISWLQPYYLPNQHMGL